MTKKQIIRCVAFLVALVMTIALLCDLFEIENTKNYSKNLYTYRKVSNGTFDAVFIGTSGVDRFWIGAKAYEETGLSVHPLSVDGIPLWFYPNLIDEALATQDPELILIDMRGFVQEQSSVKLWDARARRFLDSLPFFSLRRVNSAFKAMEYKRIIDPEESQFDVSLLFSVVKYHSKWANEYSVADNLGSKEHEYGGYFISPKRNIRTTHNKPVVYDPDKKYALDPITERATRELFDYIEEKDLNVLFVNTPKFMSDREMGIFNTVYDMLDEKGYNYIHFYKDNSSDFTVELDINKDYYDNGHLNFYGAEKFTPVLAEYLSENYNLPDRRGDEKCEDYWSGKYDLIKKTVAGFEADKLAKKAAK